MKSFLYQSALGLLVLFSLAFSSCAYKTNSNAREKILINNNWQFYKYASATEADDLIYDVRPEEDGTYKDSKDADSRPDEAIIVEAQQEVLKPWILPSANAFISKPEDRYTRPEGNPGADFPFVQSNYDDSQWQQVNLPHDWAIAGPFQEGEGTEVGGGMGRLPSNGVGWYRKKIDIPTSDQGKSIFLDVEGAMSYARVWLNGNFGGGWPYGYNSFRLDLTPHIEFGNENQLAIRLDNPNNSARWDPGGGLYRNVWITKTNAVHVGHWGTYITTPEVTNQQALVNLQVTIDNDSKNEMEVEVITHVYELDENNESAGKAVTQFETQKTSIKAGQNSKVESTTTIANPKLWGPKPTQKPHRYIAVTTLKSGGQILDKYETKFGIRTLKFDPNSGVYVNGELIKLKGVNNHHDLGALGAAFNVRAAERQLEMLQEMGCNAVRMSHNPPATGLLELADKMGILIIDEIFDSWERKKTPHDFHLIFPDWSEPDTRAFIRRDRNYPSIIMWSFGNEVGEQYTAEAGAAVAQRISNFVKEEDSTRPTTLAMNFAKPFMELPKVPDVIGLNYQG